MRGRRTLAGRGGLGAALLLLVTSCVAPEPRRVATKPPAVADAKQLVRLLAPGLDEAALAALPTQAPAAAAAALVGASPFLEQAASEDDAARARECLTAAIYYEARSEPIDGQRAVAQVVLNRVRNRAFPHSVCGVVYQGVGRGRGCQFSFACDGSMDHPRQPGAWDRAAMIATAALGGAVMAEVGDATFYHANYVLPWWASSLTRLGSIGAHIFYRWPNALERALGLGARYAGVEPGMPVVGGEEAGVTITRGGADEAFGVTVHRGGEAVASEAADAAQPVAQPRHVSAFSGGVHVHRGEDAPVMADGA